MRGEGVDEGVMVGGGVGGLVLCGLGDSIGREHESVVECCSA